jgi:hypothetical protein
VLLSDSPKNPLETASKILEETGQLIPVLDKSGHGWWRFIAIVFAGAIAGSAVILATKVEMPKSQLGRPATGMKKPADDLPPCKYFGKSLICEEDHKP